MRSSPRGLQRILSRRLLLPFAWCRRHRNQLPQARLQPVHRRLERLRVERVRQRTVEALPDCRHIDLVLWSGKGPAGAGRCRSSAICRTRHCDAAMAAMDSSRALAIHYHHTCRDAPFQVARCCTRATRHVHRRKVVGDAALASRGVRGCTLRPRLAHDPGPWAVSEGTSRFALIAKIQCSPTIFDNHGVVAMVMTAPQGQPGGREGGRSSRVACPIWTPLTAGGFHPQAAERQASPPMRPSPDCAGRPGPS